MGSAHAPENKGDDGLIQVLDAPDIDHDGVRDLVTTSFFLGRYLTTSHNGTPPVPERIYVDALSGKDGHPLWWWFYDNATDRSVRVERPRWWGRGPDGWPLLAISVGTPAIVHNLELSTGRSVSSVVGLWRVGAADFDGDGLTDLWGDVQGQIHAFRGEAPELSRSLGSFLPARNASIWATDLVPPGIDLDGDGTVDTLIGGIQDPARTSVDAIATRVLAPDVDQGFIPVKTAPADPPGSRTVRRTLGPRRPPDLDDQDCFAVALVRKMHRSAITV